MDENDVGVGSLGWGQTRMVKRLSFALAFGLVSSVAAAADDPKCGAFEMRLTNGDMRLVDPGDDGPSVGDHRVGTYDIIDADGNVIGMQIADLTIVSIRDGLSYLSGSVSGVYDEGTIHYHIIGSVGDPTVPAVRSGQVSNREYAVIGGTGIFSGAYGTVTAYDGDDGYRTHRFDLGCGS